MKKLTTLALVLMLVFTLAVSGAHADPEAMYGLPFPDFSVKTIDGNTFTLSESLKTHDLVVINFWATWCPPCCMEFPFLQEAWEKYADRVDVIAMSIEKTDTEKVLKSFAKEYGLTFSIGRDEKKLLDKPDRGPDRKGCLRGRRGENVRRGIHRTLRQPAGRHSGGNLSIPYL